MELLAGHGAQWPGVELRFLRRNGYVDQLLQGNDTLPLLYVPMRSRYCACS